MVENDSMKWNRGILKKKKSGNGKWLFCLFTFDCREDIITRYTFDLIRLDTFLTFNIDFMVSLDAPVKCMNNNFHLLTNKYVSVQYFIGFTFLENVILLVRYFQSSGSFEFIKVSIIGTFWFLLEN